MMKSIGLGFLMVACVAMLAGCNRTVYLEQETPPGSVPPPSVTPVEQEDTVRTPVQTSSVSSQWQSVVNENRESTKLAESRIADGFAKAYSAQGKPRMTVFLNRSLSDEVREWRTDSRLVTTGKVQYEKTVVDAETLVETSLGKLTVAKSGTGTHVKAKGEDGTLYEQKHLDLPNRSGMPETWMWQFEESFLGEFMKARAIMIDRATIMRLTAAESGKQGDARDLMAVKEIEINALKGKADVFIELLVHRNKTSLVGYEFKAVAKDVSNGRILATASSLKWDPVELERIGGAKYTATKTGYVKTGEDIFPRLDRVASKLAIELMDSLTVTWKQAS